MTHEKAVVIGIDGGGSLTRVMVSDFNGNIISYVESGASSIRKENQAKENVQQAIQSAVAEAGYEGIRVKGVCAGIAGFDSVVDLEWVERLTDVFGLNCPKWHVNDAVIAHAGAFLEQPGIVVVSGTGSIIFAVTENGTHIRNYDFHHYAESAARFLSYDAVFEIMAGNTDSTDQSVIQQILDYWAVRDLADFRELAVRGFIEERKDRDKKFGRMAPLITEAASDGSHLAQTVCHRAIQQISVGVEMIGAQFETDTVTVAGIGSVIRSPYMKIRFQEKLFNGNNRKYQMVEPTLSAVAGAVVMALKRLDVQVNSETIQNLRKHSHSTYS